MTIIELQDISTGDFQQDVYSLFGYYGFRHGYGKGDSEPGSNAEELVGDSKQVNVLCHC